MKILGISRSPKYSPNLSGNDAKLFIAVADALRASGHEVTTIAEERMLLVDYTPYDHVFTMARDVPSLIALTQDTDATTQAKFINSISGILACTDKAVIATTMQDEGIPQPKFCPPAPQGEEYPQWAYQGVDGKHRVNPLLSRGEGLWLKNCDGSAVTADDTVFCPTEEAFTKAVEIMTERGVQRWMAQQHQQGDLIKFYGVEGTVFFRWNYASQGHSKFGLEAINGKEQGFTFDAHRIKHHADRLAQRLRVPIYGGDVIIDANGNPWLIDFNDFPSFSSCRDEAANAIAQRILCHQHHIRPHNYIITSP